MIKQLILLIHFLGLFFYQLIFTTDVTVTQKLPSTMTPGSNVEVSIVINKNDVTGFAKVQQEIPAGFSAEVIDSRGATFSFKDQKLKMIWMSLPTEKEFTVSYRLIAKANTTGNFTLEGKFSYIADSERKNISIDPVTINVSQEIVADNEVPDTNGEGTEVQSTETEGSDSNDDEPEEEKILPVTINGSRTIESTDEGKYKVTIDITKSNVEGFTKITEMIPAGFIAVGDENKGGVFSFKDQEAKILWLSVPTEEEFTVSYVLESVTANNGSYSVDGVISYLEGDNTKTYTIEKTDLILNVENEVVAEEVVESAEDDISLGDKIQGAMNKDKEEVKEVEEVVEIVEEGIEEEIAEVAEEAPVEIVEEKAQEEIVKNEEVVTSVEDITSVKDPETRVLYKVQVAALRKQVKANYISKRFKISRPVSIESHEGWSKYILGSHTIYREAKEERDYIRRKVEKAFVTAYNQGERITVQEALMITNQKWYK